MIMVGEKFRDADFASRECLLLTVRNALKDVTLSDQDGNSVTVMAITEDSIGRLQEETGDDFEEKFVGTVTAIDPFVCAIMTFICICYLDFKE